MGEGEITFRDLLRAIESGSPYHRIPGLSYRVGDDFYHTPMTKGLREKGLITSDRVEEYDGTTAVVACENLTGKEVEFLRWKAERWMRVRHLSALFSHDPLFVIRNFLSILSFNFRGSSVRSVLGFEKEGAVFERYRAIRRAERIYV
jgi:anaerobic magnesium-protoporphyrin IX monomethyl ester cyclase